MAPSIPPALGLPEVAFRVAQYFELDEFVACTLVSKAFYACFAPYLWDDVQLGVLSSWDRTEHLQEPLRRLIVLEGLQSRRDRILQVLPKIAPWIRSLSICYGFSGGQIMKFGKQCTNLHSLLISPPSRSILEREVLWIACEALVQRNVDLRSLTLIDWAKSFPNSHRQIWGPLHTCARQANLSTLRIKRGTFYEQDLEPFWTICRQLEILELIGMDLTVLSVPLNKSSPEMEPTLHATTTTTTTTAITVTPTIAAALRFPRLRELTLERIRLEPSYQMEHFILQCPLLHTLVLRLEMHRRFSIEEFSNYLAASTWPYLDSLEITGERKVVSVKEYALLMQSTQRRFKRLDLHLGAMEQEPFDLLRKGGHFETLTKLDLSIPLLGYDHLASMVNGVDAAASRRIREVLESCPSLEHFYATSISGRDIIDSQPWVCHRLKTFKVLICMALTKQTPWAKAEYTEDDKRQCHEVFERLSQLKQLQTFNMFNPYLARYVSKTPVTLPLDLRMGLGHLSTLRDLEWLGFNAAQNMRLVDVEWMLQHWTRLHKMTGGLPAMKDSQRFGGKKVRCYLLVKALSARKVKVPTDWKGCETDVELYMRDNELGAVYDSDADS